MKTTRYFRDVVLNRADRQYLHDLAHRLQEAVDRPLETRLDHRGRTRRFVYCPEDGHYLRVVVEADGTTIHNAFRDRAYRAHAGGPE